MSKIFLASYKGTHAGWQGLINKGIRFVTQGIYSHSEIVIGDDPFNEEVYCASSTGVEGGVRSKMMKLVREDWDLIEIDWITKEDVYAWVSKYDADTYDYLGNVRFLFPFCSEQSSTGWFCSEMCGSILKFSDAWRFDPNTLAVATAHAKLITSITK